MVRTIDDVNYSTKAVIQQYLDDPLLLDGRKFDLRIYVLVTSYSPLEAFIYRQGFARLSSVAYSAASTDILTHLTNSSIQKGKYDVENAVSGGAGPHEVGGTKVSLEYLWKRLATRGIDPKKAWRSIVDVVVKSLVCVDDCIPNQPNSFEVYGYDVLLDSKLRAWLIEVNSSPSLSVDSVLDATIKMAMLRDTVKIVNPVAFDRQAIAEVASRRLAVGEEAKRRPHVVSPGLGVETGTGLTSRPQDRALLDADISRVLWGQKPRQYGEMPADLGGYERIAPGGKAWSRVMKLKVSHLGRDGVGGPAADRHG